MAQPRKKSLRIANGTSDDLKTMAASKSAKAVAKKKRKAKEPIYTGDDPVKKAYYARNGTMHVRTGRNVVPVAKVAVPKARGKAAKAANAVVVPGAQARPGTSSILTSGRIG
jgi:hypothetical protein